MNGNKLLKSFTQISVILLASLLVIGATYALGQRASALEVGDRRGFDNHNTDWGIVAQTLNISEDELRETAGMPPNYAAVAEKMNKSMTEVEAAFRMGGFRRGHHGPDHHQEGFNLGGVEEFGKTLIPMAVIILVITGGQKLWKSVGKPNNRKGVNEDDL